MALEYRFSGGPGANLVAVTLVVTELKKLYDREATDGRLSAARTPNTRSGRRLSAVKIWDWPQAGI